MSHNIYGLLWWSKANKTWINLLNVLIKPSDVFISKDTVKVLKNNKNNRILKQ